MLPASSRPGVHPHQHRNPQPDGRAEEPGDHRRGRGGRGVRLDLPPLRHRSHGGRNAAAHRAGGRRRHLQGAGTQLPQAGIRVETGARARNIERPAPACGSRSPPRTASRKSSKPRSCWWPWAASPTPKTSAWRTRGRAGPRLHQGRSASADRRAGRLRHRRRGGRHAATGARGHREGMIAVAHMAGKPATPINKQPHSRLHLHRAGHRQRGPHRSAGARAGLQGEDRPLPVRRRTAAPPSWATTRASSRWWPTRSTARSWACTSSGPEGFELIAEAVAAMEAEATVE
jgi:dihydrolipoamide dehydrogenase